MSSSRSERLEGRAYSRMFSRLQGGIQPVVHSLPGLPHAGMRTGMKSFLTAFALSVSAPLAAMAANPLTPAEQHVCQSVRNCADIVERHNIDEFDYSVLAAEFDRFGNNSVSALSNIASVETRPQLAALVAQIDTQTAINIVIELAKSNRTEDRSLAAFLLKRVRIEDDTELALPSNAFPTLARLALEHSSEDLVALIARYPFETARPTLESLLGNSDSRIVSAAYQHLYDASRNDANEALNRQMLKTEDLSVAVAIGQMMAQRDGRGQSNYYARWLDGIANEVAYPDDMQVGARAGSLMLSRRDAPFTAGPNLTEQILRLPDETLAMTIKYWTFTRTGQAVLPAWQTIMETKPEHRRNILVSLRVAKAPVDIADPFIEIGLSDPSRARTVMDAIRLIPTDNAERWSEQLNALAQTHPFDSVRHLASARLDPSIPSDDNDRIGGTDPAVITARTMNLYCVSGNRIDPSIIARQLILNPSDLAGLPDEYRASPRGARTAYPARTRWIAGFNNGEWGGSLLSFDYAVGGAELLLDENIQLITPVTPAPLGQHPDALWVFSGIAHLVMNESQVMTLAPDGDNSPAFIWELPDPLRRAYRLEDGSLLLQFHDQDDAFQSHVRDNIRYRGWTDYHPPLRLTPQGDLMPACPVTASP